MGSMSLWHWVIVGAVVLLLFGGRGKISSLMGDFAEGIKAFKKGMSEDPTAKVDEPVRSIDQNKDGLKARAETERKVEGSTV